MKIFMRLLLVCFIFIMLLSNIANCFDNPKYVTHYMNIHDGSIDTIAVLTCDQDPAFDRTTNLKIQYIVNRNWQDSLKICLYSGWFCKMDFDKYQYVWYGDFEIGDTLQCEFNFTPLDVGLFTLHFRIGNKKSLGGELLPFTFTLDEFGKVVKNKDELGRGGKAFGTLGLLPNLMKDTIYFYEGCISLTISEEIHQKIGPLSINAFMSPKLNPATYSELTYIIVPPFDLNEGFIYSINFNDDIFEIISDDRSDISGVIHAGDTVFIKCKVKPLNSGVGTITFDGFGFSESDSSVKIHTANMSVDFVLDENLNLLIYSDQRKYGPLNSPYGFGGMNKSSRNDEYRLTKAANLFSNSFKSSNNTVERPFKHMPSENYDERKKEFFKKKMQQMR